MGNDILAAIKNELAGEGASLAKELNSLALLKEYSGNRAWVGLYLFDDKNGLLRLGPFQGTPACVAIKPGHGVVGACFVRKEPIYVPDVSLFPGYISCDPIVRSEAVFPIQKNGAIIGVFDVDSPKIDGLKRKLPILAEATELLADSL
jgi:GAF domain-containing protein